MADDILIQQLEAALAASPDNTALKLLLAKKLQEAGQIDRARSLVTGLGCAGLDAGQIAELASLHLAGGDATAAMSLVEEGRERGHNHAGFLHVAAKVHGARGEWGDARRCLEQAKQIDSKLSDPQLEGDIQKAHPEEEKRPPLRILVGGKDHHAGAPAPEAISKRITFADIGGYDDLKKTIHRKIILPFQRPDLFEKYGRKAGGGILLYGPPGCGKTHLARATAGEVGALFMSVAIEDVLDMWKGESERKLHALFQQARDKAPAVVFIDEIEALGGKRSSTLSTESGALISQFLAEMDGFGKVNDKVLILGATNVPWSVDPAFRRPGRFDSVIFVPPPDREAREAILKIMLRDRPAGAVDASALAAATSGFSGADLRLMVEGAVDRVIEEAIDKGGEPPLRQDHFVQSLSSVRPTTKEWLSTARNYALYSNESGQYDDILAFIKQNAR